MTKKKSLIEKGKDYIPPDKKKTVKKAAKKKTVKKTTKKKTVKKKPVNKKVRTVTFIQGKPRPKEFYTKEFGEQLHRGEIKIKVIKRKK